MKKDWTDRVIGVRLVLDIRQENTMRLSTLMGTARQISGLPDGVQTQAENIVLGGAIDSQNPAALRTFAVILEELALGSDKQLAADSQELLDELREAGIAE
jgi:hypothetical protein